MYADLHCHPGSSAYDYNRKNPDGDGSPFHPWNIPPSNLKRQSKSKRAFGYTQSDLAKSCASNTKLLFAALYPTEKGFFFGSKQGRTRQDILELHRRAKQARAAGDEDSAAEAMFNQLTPTEKKEFSKVNAIDELQSNQMNYTMERIQYIQGGNYDYFNELIHEYNMFWCSFHDKPGETVGELQLRLGDARKRCTGNYHIANPLSVAQSMDPANTQQVVVVTIEGMHSLGTGNYSWENVKDVSTTELLQRIAFLKDPAKWPHRPFFITFSHHFNNGLCGHAHSLPKLASKLLFDQSEMCDKGFSAMGFDAALALLGLDKNLSSDGSGRILIDVKHMSAMGRKELYEKIIRPFNSRPENAGNKIPIVASHVGYSGVSHLQAQIDKALGNEERDNFKVNGFYAWNINMSSEDIIEIHNSEGLIGLSFDQRIMGQDKVFIAFNLQDFLKGKKKKRREARDAMRRTIEAMVSVPFQNNLANPHRIWEELSIGTDFDGFIDPLFGYSTVLDFPDFENDLIESLKDMKKLHPEWFTTIDEKTAARKICFENARDFVLKHYK
jgi:hypothetical protein